MKILVATGIYPPQIGGPATYSKLLYDELPQRGFGVTVVNFGSLWWLPKIVRHVVYFFLVLVRSFGVDLVYAQDPVSVGLPAMLAAKLLRKKFYVKIVGDYAWEQGVQRAGIVETLDQFAISSHRSQSLLVRILVWVELHVALRADRIIVPSGYLKRIVTAWGVPDARIAVIYNGFNPPVFTKEKESLRKELGIEGYAILSVGRLVPWKGFLMLIDLMPTLLKMIPEAHLYIVGEGPDKKALLARIAERGVGGQVTLVGRASQEKLFSYVRACDVFALNTAYEGFSHQLLEVMALGTPIVTTPVGGNGEMITHEEHGLLVEVNNHVAFLGALFGVYNNREQAARMVEAAKKRAGEFSDERMVKQLAYELAWLA